MDFAPYQSSPPEHSRVASPEGARSPRQSTDAASRRPFSPGKLVEGIENASRRQPPLHHPQPQHVWGRLNDQPAAWRRDEGMDTRDIVGSAAWPGTYASGGVSEFDTSTGLRLNQEASLAYLALPPLGAIVLLIVERNSDYVRYHAWQSALLFAFILVLHLLLSWSTFLSLLLFFGDIGLMAFLSMRAYKDAEVLDRYDVPFFGALAGRIVDDE